MYKHKTLTLMCVQPCIQYYAWQVEVMLTNFKNLRIHEEFNVQTLWAFNKNESDWEEKRAIIKKVEDAYSDVAEFHYYEDTREYPISYISSIRPNVLKQHFQAFPELSQETIFYHDCDVVFSRFPLFLHNYQQKDNNWYVSDTISYIGHDYILSKGDDVLKKMCDIVGIYKDEVRVRQGQSGGAQYIMKNVDFNFFHKVEKDSEKLFKEINELNNKKKQADPTHHELQIWCADMWAVLWNAWMRGYNTNVIKEMDFCWATDSAKTWDEKILFHNAGVTGNPNEKLFYKGKYIAQLPYEDEGLDYDPTKASYKYFEIVKSIGKNSCLYGTI